MSDPAGRRRRYHPSVAALHAPDRVETARLVLRRPGPGDVEAIFRYASDPDVTRYMSWPRHASVADTQFYIGCCDTQWAQWPAGPYVIVRRTDGVLIGSTGFAFEGPVRASTGYVLAREAWGLGYATEALGAMVDVAAALGLRQLDACCHPAHIASARVLLKCGFRPVGIATRCACFPNLTGDVPSDVLTFVLDPVAARSER